MDLWIRLLIAVTILISGMVLVKYGGFSFALKTLIKILAIVLGCVGLTYLAIWAVMSLIFG